MTSFKDGLCAGRAKNTNKIFTTNTECSQCKKPFDIKDRSVLYQRCNDGSILLWCNKCYEKHSEHWKLESAEIFPDPHSYEMTGYAKCTFKDGRIEDIGYGYNSGENSNIPKHFFDKLAEIKRALYAAKEAIRIVDVQTIDTFNENKIVITQGSGKITEINYRMSVSGVVFKESDIANIDSLFMESINAALRDRGINLAIK